MSESKGLSKGTFCSVDQTTKGSQKGTVPFGRGPLGNYVLLYQLHVITRASDSSGYYTRHPF